MSHTYWTFIEDGDFDWPHASPEEQVYFREVAAAFLRATVTIPDGYFIEVREARISQSRFPVIALGWDHKPEHLTRNERRDLVRRLIRPLNRFVAATDWGEIALIRHDAATAPGLQALTELLERHAAEHPLIRRCLDAVVSDPKIRIDLAPLPQPARILYQTNLRGGSRDAITHEEDGVIEEYNTPPLTALARMADAEQEICLHCVDKSPVVTVEEQYFVITDVNLQHLVYVKAIRLDPNHPDAQDDEASGWDELEELWAEM